MEENLTLIEYLVLTDIKTNIHCLWFNEEDELECYTYGVDDPIEPEILNMIVMEVEEDLDGLNIWLREDGEIWLREEEK